MAAKPVPDGYHTVTPYLTVSNVADLIEFIKNAFGAEITYAMKDDQGNYRHAEARIGDSMIMMGQARDEWHPRAMNFYLYVPDCDATYKQALAAGGKSLSEPSNQAYGDRHGGVEDSQGNYWWIATHVEDVSPSELEQRMKTAATTK